MMLNSSWSPFCQQLISLRLRILAQLCRMHTWASLQQQLAVLCPRPS